MQIIFGEADLVEMGLKQWGMMDGEILKEKNK